MATKKAVAVKKPIKVKKARNQTSELLSVFLKALTEYYPHDAQAPGLVLAWIPTRGNFYASIARYPDRDKRIVKSAFGDTPEEAVKNTISLWKTSNVNLIKFMNG
jgi:hypothetical protein